MVANKFNFLLLANIESTNLSKDSQFLKKQLIQIKGLNSHSTKHCINSVLHETIRRKLFIQNVCPSTRKQLWLQFTQFYLKPHFYADLKVLEIANDFSVVIQKDIKRTFRGQNIKQKTRQVLQIFCHYNPYVGYCQGMNSIIAFLISKGFSCQQSFFIFKKITEDLLPCDYYTNMDNVMAYTRIFYQMLNITHPDIYKHLKMISIEMESTYIMMVPFVLQWFVCLFSNDSISQQITQIIWDFFLIQGITILFKASLAIFDLLKPHILQCSDFESYNIMQKQIIKNIKDASYIRKRIIQTYISPKLLFLLKQKLLQPKIQQDKKQNAKKPLAAYKKNCQNKSNVCFQALQENFQKSKFYQCFVFKPNCEIKIIPNYIETLNKQYFKNEKQKDKKDSLFIGRIQHVCRRSSNTMTEGSLSDKNQHSLESTPNKSQHFSPSTNQTPTKQGQKRIRQKICQRITKVAQKKPGLTHSQSVIFMQQMAQNVSISNLLEHYDMDELFQ